MRKKTSKPVGDSTAEFALIRKAVRGDSLSPAEWGSIALTQLFGGAILVHGRFLELGLMAVDDKARPTSDVDAEFFKLITDKSRNLDEQLLEAIAKSSRAAQILPEAQTNRVANRALYAKDSTASISVFAG